jgi:tetratricopeptide (TPR) repeat protein
MHPLLRHYCAEKLERDYPSLDSSPLITQTHITQRRHSTYYLMLVQEREKAIKRRNAKTLIQEMRYDLDNIRQAWRWAVEDGNLVVLKRTLAGYVRFYTLVGLYEEASATLEWTINNLRERTAELADDPEMWLRYCELASGLLSHAAAFLSRQALYDRAMILAQAAEQLVGELDLPISKAHALLRWGEVYWYQGRMAEATPLLDQVIEMTNRASLLDVEPQELRADALCLRASMAVRMGKYQEAIQAYERSLHISRALQDAYREGRALHSLGTTFRNQGNFGEARSFLEQGLQLSRQIGDMHSESRSLNSLGDIAYYLGDYITAQGTFSQVREIAASMGDRRSESIALTNLGIIARDLGQERAASDLLTQGLYTAREIGFRRGEAWALVCLSLHLHQRHQDTAALDAAQQGLSIFEELADDVGQAYAWTEIGHALAGLQELDDAAAAYSRALSSRQALAQRHLEMEVLAGLIRVNLAQKEMDEADRKAQLLFTYLQSNRLLGVEEPVRTYWSCALALHNGEKASKILNDARRMIEERAAAIDDVNLHDSFLQIDAHRTVIQAWIAEGKRRVY